MSLTLKKYQATGNDFLLCGDGDGTPHLSSTQVARLCDRHFGFGADGVIRVLRVSAAGAHQLASSEWNLRPLVGVEVDDFLGDEYWFMDYFNADGSVAQMCGNGVRAFVAYLEDEELIDFTGNSEVVVATRGGYKTVRKIADGYQVNMGSASVFEWNSHLVEVPGVGLDLPASWVEIPNPHAVVLLANRSELQRASLPQNTPNQLPIAPAPVQGANLELVVVNPEQAVIDLRVSERGVGETLSCGTGCCATALVASTIYSQVHEWQIRVPGGQLVCELLADDSILMRGPAARIGTVIS